MTGARRAPRRSGRLVRGQHPRDRGARLGGPGRRRPGRGAAPTSRRSPSSGRSSSVSAAPSPGCSRRSPATVTARRRSAAAPTRLLPSSVLGPAALLVVLVVLARRRPRCLVAGAASALGVGCSALGVLTFVAGGLAARDAWPSLALLMAGDAVLRTVAVVACVAARPPRSCCPGRSRSAPSPGCPCWPCPPSGGAVGALGRDPRRRPGPAQRHRDGRQPCARRCWWPASRCSSRWRGRGDLSAEVGVLLATLVLVRAPLLVVLYGFRPVVLRGFLAPGMSILRRGRGAGGRSWAAGESSSSLVAALAGPAVVRAVFGEGYSTLRVRARDPRGRQRAARDAGRVRPRPGRHGPAPGLGGRLARSRGRLCRPARRPGLGQ